MISMAGGGSGEGGGREKEMHQNLAFNFWSECPIVINPGQKNHLN